jgi:glycosyltransferase involved in cell wall biosynthesis
MKILQLLAGGEAGGAELFFTRLVCALDDRNIDQLLVVRRHHARNSVFRRKNIPFHEIRYGNIFDCYSRIRLKNIAKTYGPDIVMSWMNRASSFSPKGSWINVGRLGGYYNLKYYKNCQYLVCNTRDICNYVIAHGWPENKARYIPNFVDEGKSSAIERSEFNTPLSIPLIVSIGRLHHNKAIDTLIAAMAEVDKAYLWIVGKGPEESSLMKMVRDFKLQNRIRFLGWRDNVSSIYAAADIFVCPSRHEPLGNVVLEAWAQETPVIATMSEGPGELITDKVNGLLVPVDDPVAMAAAIKKLIMNKSLAHRLVTEGKKSYTESFSRNIIIDNYLEFFSELMSVK